MTNTELRGNDGGVAAPFSMVLQTGLSLNSAPILRIHCDDGEGGHEGQLGERVVFTNPLRYGKDLARPVGRASMATHGKQQEYRRC